MQSVLGNIQTWVRPLGVLGSDVLLVKLVASQEVPYTMLSAHLTKKYFKKILNKRVQTEEVAFFISLSELTLFNINHSFGDETTICHKTDR